MIAIYCELPAVDWDVWKLVLYNSGVLGAVDSDFELSHPADTS